MGFWDRQTPAVRTSSITIAGAFGAGLLTFLAEYIGSTPLAVTSTVALAGFLAWAFRAVLFLPNR